MAHHVANSGNPSLDKSPAQDHPVATPVNNPNIENQLDAANMKDRPTSPAKNIKSEKTSEENSSADSAAPVKHNKARKSSEDKARKSTDSTKDDSSPGKKTKTKRSSEDKAKRKSESSTEHGRPSSPDKKIKSEKSPESPRSSRPTSPDKSITSPKDLDPAKENRPSSPDKSTKSQKDLEPAKDRRPSPDKGVKPEKNHEPVKNGHPSIPNEIVKPEKSNQPVTTEDRTAKKTKERKSSGKTSKDFIGISSPVNNAVSEKPLGETLIPENNAESAGLGKTEIALVPVSATEPKEEILTSVKEEKDEKSEGIKELKEEIKIKPEEGIKESAKEVSKSGLKSQEFGLLDDKKLYVLDTKNENDLETKLKDAGNNLVVIDFFAKWCGPCKMISPKIEELAKEYPDVVFLKVDVDECEDIASAYDISSMPTFVFVKSGEKVAKFSGANYEKLKETLLTHK